MTILKAIEGNIDKADSVEAVVSTDRVLLNDKVGEADIREVSDKTYKYVIKTLGPVWEGGIFGEADSLAECYYNSLTIANNYGLKTIAFPAISTGLMHFPVQLAARIGIRAVKRFIDENELAFDSIIWIIDDTRVAKVFDKEIDGLYESR